MFLAGLLGGFGFVEFALFGYAIVICVIFVPAFIYGWLTGKLGE